MMLIASQVAAVVGGQHWRGACSRPFPCPHNTQWWLSDHQGMIGGNRSRYYTVTRDTARTETLSTTLQDLTKPYIMQLI